MRSAWARGPAHRRTLAAVEDAELDAAAIGDAAHQAVQRVDLAHQMALAEPADRRIAGHRADGREAMGHQRGLRAHAGGRGRGFAAGVAAADHDDVEAISMAQGLEYAAAFSRADRSRSKSVLSRETRTIVSRETAEHESALLSYAEIPENDVQNILDIDPAGQPPERMGGQPQLLGDQLLPARAAFRQRRGRARLRCPAALAMPFAGDKRRIRRAKIRSGVIRPMRPDKSVKPSPGRSRNTKFNIR